MTSSVLDDGRRIGIGLLAAVAVLAVVLVIPLLPFGYPTTILLFLVVPAFVVAAFLALLGRMMGPGTHPLATAAGAAIGALASFGGLGMFDITSAPVGPSPGYPFYGLAALPSICAFAGFVLADLRSRRSPLSFAAGSLYFGATLAVFVVLWIVPVPIDWFMAAICSTNGCFFADGWQWVVPVVLLFLVTGVLIGKARESRRDPRAETV